MSGSAMRILVVEDDLDSARMLSLLLKLQGHAVAVAHDAQGAIAAAAEQRPDVILMDLSIPGACGLELATAFRDDAALAGTKLVAVSGHPPKGRDAHFDAYLMKPLDHDGLNRILAGFLGRSRGHAVNALALGRTP